MVAIQKEVIRKLVLVVLRERGLVSLRTEKEVPKRERRGPTVLCVFHAGVRLLERALAQVRRIEELSGRSSVFTVDEARAWVCGQDVREKAGSRCILDTVGSEGIEKVLAKADILVLPTFCFQTAARVARLTADDQGSAIVLSALMQNKPVLAASDGFTLLDRLANRGIADEIQRILGRLESFGMVLCKTDHLAATFAERADGDRKAVFPANDAPSGGSLAAGHRLITAQDVRAAKAAAAGKIALAAGGIVTPLARDLAREYAVRIVVANSSAEEA